MNREALQRISGYIVFAALVAIFLSFGSVALARSLGAVLVAGGIYSFIHGRIPYGIEGREPSGHITGIAARLVSAVVVLIGIYGLVAAPEAVCMLGWAPSAICAG